MTVNILILNRPSSDIQYTDRLVELDRQVRQNNQSPYLYPQDRSFYYNNLSGQSINVLAFAGKPKDEQIVGYATLRPMDPWPQYLDRMDYPHPQCAMMHYIIVAPDFRGMKIAAKLTDARMAAAKEKGFRYLFSTIHPDNHASNHNLRRRGFECIAQKPMFSEQLMRNLYFLDLQRQTAVTTASAAI